ncbi:DNase I-like protein [Phellopilus nigrolimitatus]|nr:DNase I-like protein [Phellopilus nigrolimitatus]
MRLLTWNINGIRTLPMYHPWNTLKTGENILNELGADVICFQEMKSSRQALEKHVALPESYDVFFSFPTSKGGYSGVGVFTKTACVVPLKAEEGLSGRLQSVLKPPLSQDERITCSCPLAHEIELVEDETLNTHNDLAVLDKEGRALMLDFGVFVLINLYCPNETSDTRLPYKMNFHLLLAERVRRLVEIDKREVIVTGDMNICAAPVDHCDGELASNKGDFWIHPARKWFHEWLDPVGPMVDVVRRCWPERKGMFTCWNQKISARDTNYGTRIDYFLLTKGLLRWFKNGDILPCIKGSDHCPVYIDLHDEIVTESGEKLLLKDLMKTNGEKCDPPRLATRYWDEYSGKQKLLSSFFGKKNLVVAGSPPIASVVTTSIPSSAGKAAKTLLSANEESNEQRIVDDAKEIISISDPSGSSQTLSELLPFVPSTPSNLAASSSPQPDIAGVASNHSNQAKPSSSTSGPPKRKKMQADSNYPAQSSKKAKKGVPAGKTKVKGGVPAQPKLSSFFATSATPSSSQNYAASEPDEDLTPTSSLANRDSIDVDAFLDDAVDIVPSPSSSQFSLSVPGSSQNGNGKGKNAHAWSTLFARVEPPRCVVHNEPAREFTVNKPGPNKGKTFFICSRPVGPGYDAGRDKRLREEVDPHYRCKFFKWSSEVRKDALRESERKNAS